MSYCSFSNNTATIQSCIQFNFVSLGNKHQLKNSNIIGNIGNKIISLKGEGIFSHCSIFNNGYPCFCIFKETSKIILQLCYTDSLNERGLGSISHNENEEIDPFVHSIHFYDNINCPNNLYNKCTNHIFLENILKNQLKNYKCFVMVFLHYFL